MSDLEDELVEQLESLDIPQPVREFRFAPPRRFRFDLCWPDLMMACEVEGATWSGGRHTRGSGFEKDCEKYNLAVTAGYQVLRVTGTMVHDGRATDFIAALLERISGDG